MLRRQLYTATYLADWIIIPRIIIGLMIADQGLGIFDKGHMEGNVAWLTDIHFPLPAFMAHVGKATELAGGILLVVGLLTRFASLALILNMTVITFVMGNGKVFSDDQHAFLYMVIFIFLFCTGGGRWSLDELIWKRSKLSGKPAYKNPPATVTTI